MQPLAFPARAVVAALSLLAVTACSDPDLVVYIAHDQQHSELVIAKFRAENKLDVRDDYDTEASKTVGLVNRLFAERANPRCDVFWNNEIAHTVRLAQEGMLASYTSPNAADIPEQFKADDGTWTGFASRARVLIINKERIPDEADYPRSIWDLTNPKWKGQCGIARPLTGTTLTHFVALRHVLGEARFEEWLDGMEQNDVVLLESNGATMNHVREGKLAFAFTDTDDFNVALDKGYPVTCVFPDQGEGEIGTMLIPNTVSIIKGGPNTENAKKLVDFLLSREVEAMLAASKAAQIPVRTDVAGPKNPAIRQIGNFRPMVWDYGAVAESMSRMGEEFMTRYGK